MSIHAPQNPLQAIREQIEGLKILRRRLCAYVNSDNFCDCKTLTGLPLYLPGEVKQRSGERSGCCEVRAAIAMLEIVQKSFTSRETKSEISRDEPPPENPLKPSPQPYKAPLGTFGNCADCDAPFEDPSARFDFHNKAGDGIESVCFLCYPERLYR